MKKTFANEDDPATENIDEYSSYHNSVITREESKMNTHSPFKK